jgi:type II restriction enzyme
LAPWDEELADIIMKKWRVGQTFNLQDIYAYEEYFAKLHPTNHNIKQKLRQVLQHLRDQDIVEFVDDSGTYRRVL